MRYMLPSFIPKSAVSSTPDDSISTSLFTFARTILLLLLVLLPVVWLTVPSLLLLSSKVFLAFFVTLSIIVVAAMALLRQGSITISLYAPLIAWGAVISIATLSAVVSGSFRQAFFGTSLEIQSVSFLLLMGIVMTLMFLFAHKKKAVFALGAGVSTVVGLLVVHQLLRFIFGSDTLTLGFLNTPTATLIGGWNDLGILLTIAVLITMAAHSQLSLSKHLAIATTVFATAALLVIAAVNFSALWVVLAITSLTILLFTLTKGRYSQLENQQTTPEPAPSLISIGLFGIVFLCSLVMLMGGDAVSQRISNLTGVSYVEVRPSFSATLDIAQQTAGQNFLLGSGPGTFAAVWQQYKDSSINETLFWNSSFATGSSYVTTWFVTSGILGLITWLFFALSFCYSVVRILLRSKESDQYWYFVATTSAIIALCVLLLSFFFVPGPVILLLGAAVAGLLFAAANSLGVQPIWTRTFRANRRTGFVFIASALMVIIATVGLGYQLTRQYTAIHTFATISTLPADENLLQNAILRAAEAYNYHQHDVYLREIARFQLIQIQELLAKEDITDADRQTFRNTVNEMRSITSRLMNSGAADATNALLHAETFAASVIAAEPGAQERMFEALAIAEALDPTNPYYALRKAAVLFQIENYDEARTFAQQALEKKSDYIDAVFLLSQIDITTGNIPEAIAATEALIVLDRQNPAQYYQLGILSIANDSLETATAAFSAAINLNPNFANALYMRGLVYAETGDTDAALTDMRTVLELNPGNESVLDIIAQLENGTFTPGIEVPDTLLEEPNTEGGTPATGEISTSDAISTSQTTTDSEQASSTTEDTAENTEIEQ